MKRFRFTLQAVLTVRERHEEQARRAVARAVSSWDAARRRWEEARAACEAAVVAQRVAMQAGATAGELMCHAAHRRAREAYVVECAEVMSRRHAELQRCVEQWRAARQARDVVERLRTRQWWSHQYAAAAAEQKQLDERAVWMAAREES